MRIPDEMIPQIRQALASLDRPKKRIVELMLERAVPRHPDAHKRCSIEFYLSPEAVLVDSTNRVSGIQLRNTLTNEVVTVPCGLLIYAIGFENILLPGLPRTNEGRLIMKDWCRVPNERTRVYATGWCAHSPSGVIAQTQNQSVAVADELVEDWKKSPDLEMKPGSQRRLSERRIQYVSFSDWKYVDECERRMGRMLGKPREKFTDVVGFLRIRNFNNKN